MRNCSIKINGVYQDEVFNLESNFNRDNGFYSWVGLRKAFLAYEFSMHTSDVHFHNNVAFELHVDMQKMNASAPCYLLLLETPQAYFANGVVENLARYRKIFTWNDSLVDGNRFIKINFPNPLHVHSSDGFVARDHFCCLISSNKALLKKDERNLYPERVNVIRWFEQYAPQDFYLYGVGWDMPAARGGSIGKLTHRFWGVLKRFVKLKPFPSYRGKVAHKREVLTKTRFSICYENIRDLPGYITEKIFDSFFSGCVPVYWGASNINDYIPVDCFIDRRKFRCTEEVYHFLKAMTEDEFKGYQQRIATFLQSDAAYLFSSEFFAETIANTIVQDLGA
jgi:alpha(1,3/1,4) fucosyltransferase